MNRVAWCAPVNWGQEDLPVANLDSAEGPGTEIFTCQGCEHSMWSQYELTEHSATCGKLRQMREANQPVPETELVNDLTCKSCGQVYQDMNTKLVHEFSCSDKP